MTSGRPNPSGGTACRHWLSWNTRRVFYGGGEMQGKSLGGDDFAHLERSGKVWEGVGKGTVVCKPLKVRDGRGERGEIGVSTLLSFFTHKQAETALKHTCSNLLRRKWENAFPPLPKLPVSLFINGLRDPVPFPSPSQEK